MLRSPSTSTQQHELRPRAHPRTAQPRADQSLSRCPARWKHPPRPRPGACSVTRTRGRSHPKSGRTSASHLAGGRGQAHLAVACGGRRGAGRGRALKGHQGHRGAGPARGLQQPAGQPRRARPSLPPSSLLPPASTSPPPPEYARPAAFRQRCACAGGRPRAGPAARSRPLARAPAMAAVTPAWAPPPRLDSGTT